MTISAWYANGMNSYDEAKKTALEKVFLSIAETGKPTEEQLKFIQMYQPKRTLDDDIKTVEKILSLMLGGK